MANSSNSSASYELNYVTANRFYVEIESAITASFSECSGVGVKVKREAIFEGGVNNQQRILLGQSEFTDITLKRGITDDLVFWTWASQILGGVPKQRRNINILLFSQAGETMQCWTLIGAVPISWKAPSLQAHSTTVAIEELSLAYEGLKIEKSAGGGAINLTSGRDKLGYFSGSSSGSSLGSDLINAVNPFNP
ncbi:phage tail protein [Leptolyngbya sp. FACHB-671]|uniref:phage tail protein n=1 Tax=Leptolyngbya sp. FACHB-671 TaxID=2692812 RepID=UPI001683687C|nr:phage tail protein [Leptolyngbya sp. FACHB-671]MBD2066467.1 phage tail protein [Leptolyngbya sp. FACHB-671]